MPGLGVENAVLANSLASSFPSPASEALEPGKVSMVDHWLNRRKPQPLGLWMYSSLRRGILGNPCHRIACTHAQLSGLFGTLGMVSFARP